METSGRADEIRYGLWVMSGHPRWNKPSRWLAARMTGESAPQKLAKPHRPGGIASVRSVWTHRDLIELQLVTTRETGSLCVTEQTMKGVNVKSKHWVELARYVDKMAARAHAEAFGVPDEFRPMVDSRHTDLTDEFLTRVAAVYVDGGTQGRKAVAEFFSKPPSTADNWLAKARAAGILGPAPARGRAGSTEREQR